MTVCKECRNCDWFWEERNPDKECLGEEQPCERFMCLKSIGKSSHSSEVWDELQGFSKISLKRK